MSEKLEELISLLYQDRSTQCGKRSLVENIEKLQKENEKALAEYMEWQKQELDQKDKIIDLMAEYIEDELTVDEFCTKEGCYADNYIDGHCEKCLNCIKQYFENKAKEIR
jgi:hypothetical protein|nr:MAG TPA: hypothetical protein [Caudoviricetes sp.]